MRCILIFAIASALAGPAAAEAVSGPARIVDGDTIEVAGTTVRLEGIDAPEAGQTCERATGRGRWACGDAAMDRLAALIGDQPVRCAGQERDAYGRLLGECFTAGGDWINDVMVRDGFAWAFVRYSDRYEVVEREAREARRGVFQAPTETPWDYRAARWKAAEQTAPEGCPIKGNINRKQERIYHAPWSPWYGRTKVSPERGERWFCDEAEALAAGWRAPFWR